MVRVEGKRAWKRNRLTAMDGIMDIKKIVHTVMSEHKLPNGIHGFSHWARVLEIGQRLAEINSANMDVVRLFALFHDSRRVNDGRDPGHGLRGAEFAASLNGSLFELAKDELELLRIACAYHTDGLIQADITVQTCWDSDRLDLSRAGIIPDPRHLCTDAARNRDMMDWANERGTKRILPEFVESEWGIAPL